MTEQTKTGWEFRPHNVERDPVTQEVRRVTITAAWEGVRRYQASFRKRPGAIKGKLPVQPHNTHRFNEQGDLESSNILIPISVRQQMIRYAIAIIFPKE